MPTLPNSLTLYCGIILLVNALVSTYAIMLTSYPVVMMFKTCNIMMVIITGICCSKVRDKTLKLTGKKILVAIIVTIGLFLF